MLQTARSFLGCRTALAQARRAAFVEGMRAFAPAVIATGAWGLVTGVAMVRSGLHVVPALVMSVLVFAGSAQLAALPLMAAAAPVWLVLLAATIVNLRFVIFSAGLQPHLRHLSLGRRLFLGYITGDVPYLLVIRRWIGVAANTEQRSERVWFFLGLSFGNALAWHSMSILGILLAYRIPDAWGMEFVGVLALITLVEPVLVNRPAVIGVLVAAVTSVAARHLPLKLSVLVAVVAGVAAAAAAEILQERRARVS